MQLDQIIGQSPTFLDLMDHISRAAPMNRPILVVGERGSGKEMIAARLHYLSHRWNQPYQKMNCAALAETLLESELFGYEPGAFTGASKRRAGRFEAADKGSLFLDEIGTMSLSAQEKLLRVIEYGEFERVGGVETVNIDVRVIGATNIDLPAAADRGTFRYDLLDRLAFDVLTVPPLRARREDIPVLAHHFGSRIARELEWLQFPGFTAAALQAMLDHSWPGNIRELKNVVERAVYSAWDGEEPVGNIVFNPFDSPFRPTEIMANSRQPAAVQTPTATPYSHTSTPPPNTARSAAQSELGNTPFDFKEEVRKFEAKLLDSAHAANKFHGRKTADYMGLNYDQFRHLLNKHHKN